jgi:hypothetical protein
MSRKLFSLLILWAVPSVAAAGVGDPQLKTEHPWYPGELSCSTFERLFETQTALYERVTGRPVKSDEDKALASWYWRNLNYFHCTSGPTDYYGRGWKPGGDNFTRDYWTGLFANGFGLCYATHAQWCGELAQLLGRGNYRGAGVSGHHSFEVYLTGGAYGSGRWALLDHDVSTVIFAADGRRLMSLGEISEDPSSYGQPHELSAQRQHGWLAGGLHRGDPSTYAEFNVAYYDHGYAGPPPYIHLRTGESLRRYLNPGLEDGKTFVYWGINYNEGRIPGPSRHRTWVNQPEKMFGAKQATPYRPGQARYANAVYTYRPNFASGDYREGVMDESDRHVTFEFFTPYVIAATPPPEAAGDQWGICKQGCTGGLVLHGTMTCPVEVSTDQGATWHKAGRAKDGLDLTDLVKGRRQFFIRLQSGAKNLAGTGLTIRTVCQCSPCIIPRLMPGENRITYQSSGKAVVSAGPYRDQATAHLIDGAMDSPAATLRLATPRGEKAVHLYAAARQASGCPPRDCRYRIEYSTDGGNEFRPVVENWQIIRHKPEPPDWWSQSFCSGNIPLPDVTEPVQVRFGNDGGRSFMRVEAHLVYEVKNNSPITVTFCWKDGDQQRTTRHTYKTAPGEIDRRWSFDAGRDPQTEWVEYASP